MEYSTTDSMADKPIFQPTTPRPKRDSPAVINATAELLYKDLERWLLNSGAEEEDAAIYKKDIADAIKYEYDGYQIARNLDSSGWDPDAELVDILDNVTSHAHTSYTNEVAKWLESQDTSTPPTVGARVQIKDSHIGEIIGNRLSTAESTVFIESIGHVRSGNGTRGTIVDWEKLYYID